MKPLAFGTAALAVLVCAPAGAQTTPLPTASIGIDLSDDWVPAVLAPDARGVAADYRERYMALASHEGAPLSFGVVPTISVAAARLTDHPRHECQRDVDLGPIFAANRDEEPSASARRDQRERMARLRRLEGQLRGSPGGVLARRAEALRAQTGSIIALQDHLECEGLLDRTRIERGVLDAPSTNALRGWQARVGLVPTGSLDGDTRAWLALGSREIDFRLLLRVLRERVASGTAFLADGTAVNDAQQVLGRDLDPPSWRTQVRPDPLPNGIPDRVGPATEVVARQLGWLDPESADEALARRTDSVVVELVMPPRPTDLRVEIDRGDIWYEYPWNEQGQYIRHRVQSLPTMTLFAEENGQWRPVVRWPTTVGGWNREETREGEVGLQFHDSPVGPVVWRDMVVGPRWLPPSGIPDDSLLRRNRGRWEIDRTTVGPGPDSAYGLVMLVHHRMRGRRFEDQGIRSHGTGNLPSVIDATRDSHGCHRLFNHLVLRMSRYLLENRSPQRVGPIETNYRRTIHTEHGPQTLDIESRGYRIVLDPPVPVEVLEGTIRSEAQEPPTGLHPLPHHMQRETW